MAPLPQRNDPAATGRRRATTTEWSNLRRRARLWSLTVWIIAACCAVHVARVLVPGLWVPTEQWGGFNVADGIYGGQLWRVLSFQFLHGSLLHLGFNCMGLWIFGPTVERRLGRARFLAYYLLCGVGGALGYALLYWTNLIGGTSAGLLVGASAGVFGLIAAAMVLAPDRVLMLAIPPIDITVFRFGLVLLFVGAVMVVGYGHYNGSNAGGHAAHLGGAAVGFLLARRIGWLDWAERLAPKAWRSHPGRTAPEPDVEAPSYMKYHGWR